MTIEAVAVLQTLARDEFEESWYGAEDFSWVTGDIEVELGGKTYVLGGRAVVEAIEDSMEGARWEAEEEADEADSYPSEDEISEKILEKVNAFWFDQLDSLEEHVAVFDSHLNWVVKGFGELVAYFDMVGERVPELQPILAAKLMEVSEETVAMMTRVMARWPDAQVGPDDEDDAGGV